MTAERAKGKCITKEKAELIPIRDERKTEQTTDDELKLAGGHATSSECNLLYWQLHHF